MIQRKILISPVTIHGRSFLGKKCSISFLPSDIPGWFIRTKSGKIIPIDFRIASYKKGRIVLCEKESPLNVYEHLGALRFTGIDNVIIDTHGNAWTPYLTAGQYLDYFGTALQPTNGYIPTITAKRESCYRSGNALRSLVRIKPLTTLELRIITQWKGLPLNVEHISFNNFSDNFLSEVFMAKPQGLSQRKLPAQIVSLFGWPHMKQVAWIDDFDTKADAAYAWWLHRIQDTLGELSLCDHAALPTGYIISYKSGHYESLCAIVQAFS